jgi:hypothetical protein
MGAILKTLQVMWVIAILPAIEGLGANPEVATSKPSVVVMRVIVVQPFDSLPGSF